MSMLTDRVLPYGSDRPEVPNIKGYKSGLISNFTPSQMGILQQLQGLAGPQSMTSRLAAGDQSQFGQLEAPALQQFNALQGNLASRFSGMGLGARKSSGFNLASNQAASDFAQQLQSQRLGLQNQAIQQLQSLYSEILGQRPYETYLMQKQKKPSFLSQLFAGLGGAASMGAGAGAGNFTTRLFGG